MVEATLKQSKGGFFGKGKKKTEVAVVESPKEVEYLDVTSPDDDSIGSSQSGGSKPKKKPRAEYQKQIDWFNDEKKTLQKEKATVKANLDALKGWALNPPCLPTGTIATNVFETEETEVVEEKVNSPKSKTKLFRKKPRAEYQAEIDAICMENHHLKDEIHRMKREMSAIKKWSKQCPV